MVISISKNENRVDAMGIRSTFGSNAPRPSDPF